MNTRIFVQSQGINRSNAIMTKEKNHHKIVENGALLHEASNINATFQDDYIKKNLSTLSLAEIQLCDKVIFVCVFAVAANFLSMPKE